MYWQQTPLQQCFLLRRLTAVPAELVPRNPSAKNAYQFVYSNMWQRQKRRISIKTPDNGGFQVSLNSPSSRPSLCFLRKPSAKNAMFLAMYCGKNFDRVHVMPLGLMASVIPSSVPSMSHAWLSTIARVPYRTKRSGFVVPRRHWSGGRGISSAIGPSEASSSEMEDTLPLDVPHSEKKASHLSAELNIPPSDIAVNKNTRYAIYDISSSFQRPPQSYYIRMEQHGSLSRQAEALPARQHHSF